ncbi:MAG: hypothetical protein KF760_24435 [Candidatus Eremiobacteraeota bacterium]|nr:hypothetical protein [Candidatus Eremiobacteraeota bacterium]MCW5867528.1 hypothetical protein [Candidatus Eremiobacteraeota bacterium]
MLRILVISLLCALPAFAYPVKGVVGNMGDTKRTYPIKDAIVVWWTKYGVTGNVVEVHLFSKKLSAPERKSFSENLGPAGDLERVLDKNRAPNSALDSPRMVLQAFYGKQPRNLSQGPLPGGAAMWLSGPGNMDSGGLGGTIHLNGPLQQGTMVELSGEGSNGRVTWGITGSAPLIILSTR